MTIFLFSHHCNYYRNARPCEALPLPLHIFQEAVPMSSFGCCFFQCLRRLSSLVKVVLHIRHSWFSVFLCSTCSPSMCLFRLLRAFLVCPLNVCGQCLHFKGGSWVPFLVFVTATALVPSNEPASSFGVELW